MASQIPAKAVPSTPPRPLDAHKGTFGTVMVVGGCPTMIGAPALCATAALRAGCGLVKIAATSNVLPTAIGIEPAATGVVISASSDDTQYNLDQADPKQSAVLAVGPGMGPSPATAQLVANLLGGPRPVVLDADGLHGLAATQQTRPANGPELVLTPHPGEFKKLACAMGITADPADPQARPQAAARLAQAHQAVVVLKGYRTVVSDGHRQYINATGNPALATAGSGDVLTGLIAALMAQQMTPFDAAVLGVYLHGLAGDMWAQQFGPSGLTARDLAQWLPRAFHQHRGSTSASSGFIGV